MLVGCAADSTRPNPTNPIQRIDLSAALGTPHAEPVGVAVSPTGERFVFDRTLGLYRALIERGPPAGGLRPRARLLVLHGE